MDKKEAGIDLVSQYMSEIGQYPLLTKQDEYRLGETIAVGRGAEAKLQADDEHVKAIQNLGAVGVRYSQEHRAELQQAVSEADEARETFINSNLRLVVSIARRYQTSGMTLLDIIQEGNMGLHHAVEKFDHEKGFKFSTYATWWIRQAIGRGIGEMSGAVRLPTHRLEEILAYKRAVSKLEQRGIHDPDESVLAEELGKEPGQIGKIRQLANSFGQAAVSLDAPAGEGDESTVGDFLPGDGQSQSEMAFNAFRNKELVEDIIKNAGLSEQEVIVLRCRFGLDDDIPYTLAETGREFGVTRERIRQIEVKALGKAGRYLEFKNIKLEDVVA